MPNDRQLHRINNLLLALIIAVNLYIVLVPFAPGLIFWYQRNDTSRRQQLSQKIKVNSSDPAPSPAAPQPNQLVIPSILLDQKINEGNQTYVELAKGVWRWPKGSTPDQGGNTVFVGHRFTYTDPRGVFYELNEIKQGDSIGVIWNNKTYNYTVATINQVNPDDTAILQQTSESELTLYTCTPLFAPKYRLVIVADLENHT